MLRPHYSPSLEIMVNFWGIIPFYGRKIESGGRKIQVSDIL